MLRRALMRDARSATPNHDGARHTARIMNGDMIHEERAQSDMSNEYAARASAKPARYALHAAPIMRTLPDFRCYVDADARNMPRTSMPARHRYLSIRAMITDDMMPCPDADYDPRTRALPMPKRDAYARYDDDMPLINNRTRWFFFADAEIMLPRYHAHCCSMIHLFRCHYFTPC